MSRTKSLLAFLVLFGFAAESFAANSANILRGGLGFLFPDHNSFINPGQFAASHGMAVEAMYGRDTASGPQSVQPSFVYGNGAIGFGAFASRSGADLLSGTHTDTAGVALGANLLKGRLTIGGSYLQTLTPSSSGSVTGTLTFNSPNRQGVSVGVGYTRPLTGATAVSSLTAGLGYSFMSNNNLEVNFKLADITSMSSYDLGVYFTTMKGMVYLGGGYVMSKSATTAHGVSGRLGFMLGQHADLSATATHYFVTGAAVNYGGTFRASF